MVGGGGGCMNVGRIACRRRIVEKGVVGMRVVSWVGVELCQTQCA